MSENNDFGMKLKSYRKAREMSQADFAAFLGIPFRTYQNYESGHRYPRNMEVVNKIAVALGVTAEDLLGAAGGYIVEANEKGGSRDRRRMPGSPFQKREYRKIAVGIGGHIHVEVVTEEIAFPMRVPSPVAVRLRIMAFAAAGRTAFFLAITDPFFPLLRGSADRSAVTGKSQMVWVNQSFLNRTLQELLLIETENKGKRIFLFEFPMFQQRKEFGCGTGRITGSFFTFLFPFGWFHFRETVFRGKIVGVVLPDAGKEIIKSPDAGSIPERETAKDGIKGSFPGGLLSGRAATDALLRESLPADLWHLSQIHRSGGYPGIFD